MECHNTFTIGEAMIMAQSVVLFSTMCIVKFFFELHSADEETEFIGVLVYVSLILIRSYFCSIFY